jgi:signal peptidase I
MGSNGGGNNNFEDPNPGGMRQDDDPNQGRNRSDENFLETLKAWINSDEGKDDIKTYTTSLVLALLLRLTIIEPRYIPSLSMYPTFEIGDQLAVEKVSKRIRPFDRNEVVVFNPPASFRQIIENNDGGASKKSKEALIKRIVAVEVSIIYL